MSVSRPAAVIVLAAGEGTRMKSRTPKVLHDLCGRSMLGHVLAAVQGLDPEQVIVVVGHGREAVAAHLAEVDPSVIPVVQDPRNGTGHAVRTAIETVGAPEGTTLVTYADTPLLRTETMAALLEGHEADGNAMTALTAEVPDPTGYGRIVRDDGGAVHEVVEEKDATPGQRAISEINSGVYVFDGSLLAEAVKRLSTANAQGEEYLTEVFALLRGDEHRVGATQVADHTEILGINDRVQLAETRRLLNERILVDLMRAGVTVIDPRTTWVDVHVTCEPDAVIQPDTQLMGFTHLASGAAVGPGCSLRDTTVGEYATVINAVCVRAEVGPDASVGPYVYLRPGTLLGEGAKVGSFVEVKAANVGDRSKVPHLSYVGDAEIGEDSNIGAATVFVNYDGQDKHRTNVGDHVRIGSDTMLVAPLDIGDGAYTAAGSVITEDVPPGTLAVARGRQRNVEGWVERKRPTTRSAEAARRARRASQPPEDTSA
ncbi:MAG: bifunctional UDP-N-acetylglucosamine diphosphorylase/glucosamine-1-phosphate N-acetyltransferase GlmU [Streptosporangiaceae bacterium]